MPPLATHANEYSPRSASFADIVLAVRRQLVEVLELAPERVVVVANRPDDSPSTYPAEKHVRLRPMGRTGLDNPGAGRLSDRKTRVLAVDVVTRDTRDQAGSDLVALTDANVGHLRFEESILDALDKITPVDEDGNALTYVPVRETTTDDPNRPRPAEGFVADTIYLAVDYIPRYKLSRT